MISTHKINSGMGTYQLDRVQIKVCKSTRSEKNALLVSSNVRVRQDREQYGYPIRALACCPSHLGHSQYNVCPHPTPGHISLVDTSRILGRIELYASEYLLRNRIQYIYLSNMWPQFIRFSQPWRSCAVPESSGSICHQSICHTKDSINDNPLKHQRFTLY